MTAAATTPGAPGCLGDSCPHPSSWPLHHVRLRGSFLSLCTSCVLKQHPGSFCPFCFDVMDDAQQQPSPELVRCSRCPSVAHPSCIPSPSSRLLCPPCSAPSTSSFSFLPPSSRLVSPRSSRILLAASHIALASMRRAAAAARADADRKFRDSLLARRRARESLEQALLLARRDRHHHLLAKGVTATGVAAEVGTKRKAKSELARKPPPPPPPAPKSSALPKITSSNQDMLVTGGNAARTVLGTSANVASLPS